MGQSNLATLSTPTGSALHAPRSPALDTVRFFLRVLVPVCHLLEHGQGGSAAAGAAFLWILLFNMPAFALVSGAVTSARSCALREVVNNLLLPYLLFQTLYCLFDAWLFHTGQWLPSFVTPNWLLWYLVSLACWRLATPVFLRLRWPLACSIVLALAAGCFNDIGYAFSLSRTLVFFPFFLWGQQLGPTRLQALSDKRGNASVAVLVLAVAFAAAWRWHKLDPAWLYNAVSYETLRLSPGAGAARRAWILLGAAACSLAAVVLSGRAASWFRGWLALAGRRSMAPYVLHGFVLLAFSAGGGVIWVVARVPAAWLLPVWTLAGLLLTIALSTRIVSRLSAPLLDPRWLERILFRRDAEGAVPARRERLSGDND